VERESVDVGAKNGGTSAVANVAGGARCERKANCRSSMPEGASESIWVAWRRMSVRKLRPVAGTRACPETSATRGRRLIRTVGARRKEETYVKRLRFCRVLVRLE